MVDEFNMAHQQKSEAILQLAYEAAQNSEDINDLGGIVDLLGWCEIVNPEQPNVSEFLKDLAKLLKDDSSVFVENPQMKSIAEKTIMDVNFQDADLRGALSVLNSALMEAVGLDIHNKADYRNMIHLISHDYSLVKTFANKITYEKKSVSVYEALQKIAGDYKLIPYFSDNAAFLFPQ